MTSKLISRLLYSHLGLLILTSCAIINFSPQLGRAEVGRPSTSWTVRVERPLGGWINLDLARQAALAAARREAAARARPTLELFPEVSALADESAPGAEGAGRRQMFELLARFLLEPDGPPRVSSVPSSGGPAGKAGGRLVLEQSFRLGGIEQIRQKLTLLLSAPALLENYGLALQLEQDCLDRYDAAVAMLLAQPTLERDKNDAAAGALWQEVAARHNGLRACALYLEILPTLYQEGGA